MRKDQRQAALARILPVLEKRSRNLQWNLITWERTNGRKFPWRDPHRTPYQVLVSEVLLKRTTSTAAARTYNKFVKKYPRLRDFLSARSDEVEDLVRGIGLQTQRREAFQEIARTIKSRFGGILRPDFLELSSIKHVGSYTAAAIMSFGFGIPAPLVDSNVARIYSRMFVRTIGKEKPDERLMHEVASGLLPFKSHSEYNYGLLDLGATVCRYDYPRCTICPVAKLCDTGISTNLKTK